jgi:hypothetical protein
MSIFIIGDDLHVYKGDHSLFELDEHFHVSLAHTVIEYLMRLLQATMPDILVSEKVIDFDGDSPLRSSVDLRQRSLLCFALFKAHTEASCQKTAVW